MKTKTEIGRLKIPHVVRRGAVAYGNREEIFDRLFLLERRAMEERIIIELFKNGRKLDEEDISDLTSRDLNIYFHSVAAKGLKYKFRKIKVPEEEAANG